MLYIRTRLHKDILWLILDRPPLNLLNSQMLDQLTAALRNAIKLKPRLIVLMGAGDTAFSAGLEVQDQLDGRADVLLQALAATCSAFAEVQNSGIATTALVKGSALGAGCELAALCDTILAHEDATFGLPQISQGVFAPVAATCFPKLLGYQNAMRLLLTGEIINASSALRLGLVHQVLAARHFLSDAEELLVMLASATPARP